MDTGLVAVVKGCSTRIRTPSHQGFAEAVVLPGAASFNEELGEFVLPYEAVRTAARPNHVLLDFLQSTYEAAADAAGWDRAALER